MPVASMSVRPSQLSSDIDQWSTVSFPEMSQNLSSVDYSMKVGLFGYDMTNIIESCETAGGDCRSQYYNYDGWSQGAYMKFSYSDGFNSYHNFGACWTDGNCWGAWLSYNSQAGEYLSTEISFKHNGDLSSSSPSIPSNPTYQFYQWYENNMYSVYNSSRNYIWYYMNSGAVFARWQDIENADKYQVGDAASIWTFSDLSVSGNKENANISLNSASTLLAAGAAIAVSSSVLF